MKQIRSIYNGKLPKSLAIADLGCSSGPNTLSMTCELIETVEMLSRELNHESPEYIIFLNDLPGNDFNNIFKSLECFKQNLNARVVGGIGKCYITGLPASFYERILPTSSLHFVHSSYSVHWMSQVCNINWSLSFKCFSLIVFILGTILFLHFLICIISFPFRFRKV